ncbi:hypothetical protein [Acetobacterium sp.]|uniref:hypothetical protein n=1 Tax=Acetobacterium sp. TaxID=1872094 RepID=UPI002F42E2E5
MTDYKTVITYKINRNEIQKLLRDVLGIGINSGSAFLGAAQAGIESKNDLRDVYQDELKNQEFILALRIVAEPDLYVVNRFGGGVIGLDEVRLHRKKSEGEYVVATTVQEEDGTCIMQIYENYRAYLAWWIENFAGNNEETIANYIPPKISLEEFLFVLHAIDSFRMISYQNMLDHVYTERAHIKYDDFAKTMAESIKSRDIRWLLPAFMAVMPGFEAYDLDMAPENAAYLIKQGIMENAKLVQNDELVLVFGEGGQSMGVEFFRFWVMSSGFEINVKTSDDFEMVERLFNAPTAISNHFVRMEIMDQGKGRVNHQAFTREQLEVKLDELFSKAFELDTYTGSSV